MDGAGAGAGRKKLKHRLAAILSALSRRAGGGRKRRDEAAAPPPALALPSYSRLGSGRRLSVSAARPGPRVHITIDCAGRRSVDAADPSLLAPLDVADARKVERRLTETGLAYETGEWEGRKCPPSSPFAAVPPPMATAVPRWKERPIGRRLSAFSSRRLVSSSSSDDEYDEDSRNLFSSDSSDFYNCARTKNVAKPRASVSGPCQASARRGASQSCRYSFELPRGSTASAAADGGFAVVKRSADPYNDFRKSMSEMIAEWPAAGEHSAERLLETYLVLNSPRHYPAILAAFADVQEKHLP